MKKITFIILAIIIIFVKTGQCNDTLYTNNIVTGDNIQICYGTTDSVRMIGPVSGDWQFNGIGFAWNCNSIIVPISVAEGDWSYITGSVANRLFHLALVTMPVPAWNGTDTNTCGVFSINLNAQPLGKPGTTYLWSTGQTTQTISATQAGWYTVTVSDSCGSITDSIQVIVDSSNNANLGGNDTICLHDTLTLVTDNSNIATYSWSTTATTPTIGVYAPGNYSVTTTDNNGCISIDTMLLTVTSPTAEEICFVEFDTTTWWNNIVLPTPPANADSVRIYKETSLGVWTPIGKIEKTILNFLDSNSNPQAQSYSYKIAVIDTCGNESTLSNYHTTITLLSAYDGGSNTYGFTWSAYYGLTVPDYKLYGIKSDGTVTLIGTVPGNQFFYNYVNPNVAFIKYFVGFETPSCSSSKTNVLVKSNFVQSITGIREIAEMQFSIYPNPASDHITLAGEGSYITEISDLLGQVLLTSDQKIININSIPSGIYMVKITLKSTPSGVGYIQKLIIQ